MDNKDSIRDRLRGDLGSKGWWYGAIGGVLSTVIGIALTFGVSEWMNNRSDRRDAREMMFNVVKTAKDNGAEIVHMDSIYRTQILAISILMKFYKDSGADIEKVPVDSIQKYFDIGMYSARILITRPKTESYFYSAETMHQFDNPEIYSRFATYVEYDKNLFARIDALHDQGKDLIHLWMAYMACDNMSFAQAVGTLIKNRTLFDYSQGLLEADLDVAARKYDDFYHEMLNEMGATEEEFEAYDKAYDCEKYKVKNKGDVKK